MKISCFDVLASFTYPWCSLRYLSLSRAGHGLLHDIAVGPEPVAVGHELAALDGEDLDPAAALVVLRRDLERRYETAERKALDLLKALLHVLACRLLAAVQLERLTQRLDLDRRLQQPAVVDHGIIHG